MSGAPGDEERRAGRNQTLFREINERIRDIGDADRVPTDEPWDFLCECADVTCTETIRMTVDEYEDVRSHPTRFPVLPGHQRPDIETVVEVSEHYAVVEKRGAVAAMAIERNPRGADEAA